MQFELNWSEDGKSSLRDHLEQVERTTGKTPSKLDDATIPMEYLYIWEIFSELRQAQNQDMPISYLEIKAWCELNQLLLSAFEVRCIKALDSALMRFIAGKAAKHG